MCMAVLPDVCLEPRNNWLDIEVDPDYTMRIEPDLTYFHETRGLSRAKDQSTKL